MIAAVAAGFMFMSYAHAEDGPDSAIPDSIEAITASPESESKTSLSVDISAALFSKYVWRGQLINDENVFQPSTTLKYLGFTASLWSNLDITDYHDSDGEFTEYDWTLTYSGNMPGTDIINYTIGAIYYDFPDSDLNTTEVFGSLCLNTLLSPTISVYRDIDEYEGIYTSFGLSHNMEKIFMLGADMSVGMMLSANIGWGNGKYNEAYWNGLDENGFNDLTFTTAFPISFRRWLLTPCASYVALLDSNIRDADTYSANDSDFFFAGLTLSIGF
jgi:hypothetical protein